MISNGQTIKTMLNRLKLKASRICRIALGLVFITSGVLKVLFPSDATIFFGEFLVTSYPVSLLLVHLLSLGEIAVGGMFLSGFAVLYASVASILLLLVGTIAAMLFSNHPIPCGCFGGVLVSRTDEWFFMRNLSLIILSMFLLRKSGETETT